MMDAFNRQNLNAAARWFQQVQIQNDEDLDDVLELLESLMHKENEEKNGSLRPMIEYLSEIIRKYEAEKALPPGAVGREVLAFLMEEHGHRQKDLADIAPASVISNILKGKRELNKGQIKRLAVKYHVPPGLFLA